MVLEGPAGGAAALQERGIAGRQSPTGLFPRRFGHPPRDGRAPALSARPRGRRMAGDAEPGAGTPPLFRPPCAGTLHPVRGGDVRNAGRRGDLIPSRGRRRDPRPSPSTRGARASSSSATMTRFTFRTTGGAPCEVLEDGLKVPSGTERIVFLDDGRLFMFCTGNGAFTRPLPDRRW